MLRLTAGTLIAASVVGSGASQVQAQGQQAAAQAAEQAAMEAQMRGAGGYGESEYPGMDNPDDMYMEEEYGMGSGDPYGDGGYGSGYGGPSSSGGRGPAGPPPMAMFELFQPDWSPLGERVQQIFTSTRPSGPVALGPVLRNEAHVAYRYGNLPLALQLFHGYLARGSEHAEEQMDKVLFSKHFRKPLWHLRVGVSLGLHGDTETSDPSPISGSGTSNRMNDGMGMDDMAMGMEAEMMGMAAGMGAAMEAGMREGMAAMAGEMQGGMEEMGMGMDDLYAEDGMGMGGPGMGPPGMGGPGMGVPGMRGPRGGNLGMAAAPKAEMTDAELDSRMQRYLGLVAETVKSGLSKRIKDGKFGHALVDVAPESTTQGHTVNGDSVDAANNPMWIPSVQFVGEGNFRDTVKNAHYAGLDLLFHFDVGLKENRMGVVSNVSRLKVLDARSGKTLVSSGPMDNTEVERMARVGRGSPSAYVDEQLKSLWSVVDERLTLSSLPDLSPEVTRKRVAQVLGDSALTPLRKLAEIRYYGYRGWLTPDEVEQAFEITGGADAMKILHGSDTQAIEAIHELVALPKSE
ncbi:hypothetical protein LOC71_01140 [Rhodopirellula sp. JC740]|uniref:Uncharacterized protein n=1 Tax=Rhodopirellula halodulae TaxID=2894198 RepID=A0ABS8NBC2_9BACT|nr:hypothetical protein [Rhodopirellula sp. JC740]MCC9640861.1 hypothetical protein [Rhodopirellula sp. JC740]